MSALRDIGGGPLSPADARAVVAQLLAAPGTERVAGEADALSAQMRACLRTRPTETQLWMRGPTVDLTVDEIRSTRLEVGTRGAWGRVFALYGSQSALTPAVREAQVAAGTHVRVHPVPFTLLVVGHELAVVGQVGDVPGGHRVVDPVTVADLRALFLRLWSDSAPVTGDPVCNDVLWLVRLLTSGLPDTAAAARMGVSLRTYRRRIADLSAVLGVSGRFAAGVEADRRGIIELAARAGITAISVGADVAS